MSSDRVKFELDFGSGAVDITDRVMRADGFKGRESVLEGSDPGDATIVLNDPDRDFDPLNGGSRTVDGTTITANDLGSGVAVMHSIRESASDPWVVYWRGEVDDWVPSVWLGDATDTNPTVTLQCTGAVGELNRAIEPTAGDLLVDKLSRAQAGAFYAFNNGNGSSGGRCEDQSGRGADAISYAVTGGSASYGSITPGTTQLLGGGEIVTPLPADLLRTSPQGWFAAFVFELANYADPGAVTDYFVLGSEGVEDSTRDGTTIYLRDRYLGPGIRDMFLGVAVQINGSNIVNDLLDVGVPADWKGQQRLVLVGADASEWWIIAAALDGGTINGATSQQRSVTHPNLGVGNNTPAPAIASDSRLFRVGRRWDTSSTGPASGDGFTGALDTAVIGYGAASYGWGQRVLELALADGMTERTNTGRIEQLRDLVGFPSSRWTTNVTSTTTYNEATLVGGSTALERIAALVDVEQGRLCQELGGGLRFDDFAACKAQAAASGSTPTYTDQGDPDLVLGYVDATMSAGRGALINRATVRLPTGYTYTAENATSVSAHGVRAASAPFDLLLVSETHADAYADAIVDRFGTQRPHVPTVTVLPRRNPSLWWPELVTRDIGDRVVIERQPAGVGTVASVASVVEGVRWSWVAGADEYAVTFHLSPAATYDGHTFP